MSSFFQNVDARYENPLDIPLGDQSGKIRTLKARVRIELWLLLNVAASCIFVMPVHQNAVDVWSRDLRYTLHQCKCSFFAHMKFHFRQYWLIWKKEL